MRYNIQENIGVKINRLTLVGFGGIVGNGIRKVVVKCDCGKEICIVLNSFLYGKTKSCGCFRSENSSKKAETHNLSKHPLYSIWVHIVQRCYDENDKTYKRYGAIGVTMSPEWRSSPKLFIDWAIKNGWKKGMQIDKDIIPQKIGIPALLYSSEMCSVVTGKENANCTKRSRWVTYENQTMTISQWSDKTNISEGSIWHRLNKGWSISDALTIPIGVFSGSNKIIKRSQNQLKAV